MPISDEKKLIFIHIPKNAGTSLEKTLNMRATGHKTYLDYKRLYPKEYEQYDKFAVVRNPYDRFISCFEYARMDKSYWHDSVNVGTENKSIYGKHPDYTVCHLYSNINTFIKDFEYRFYNDLEHDCWKSQTYWIANDSLLLETDYLVRYEHLNDDLMLHNIINEPLPIINKTHRENSIDSLTDESKQIINKFYDIDFMLLNYKKE